MDLHYNAFISYRHHPQDIKVAETIHRSLERFKVPKALKQQGKTIDRLFRDKEELPITSSLTDNITMALRNSDYQIVICSTHLKDSYWVQREIETFLQTHTKDKVLTVLVDGDNPYDVIPEILTYNEVVDPVTGEVTREPIEPLSCDWRLPRRQAMREELPRLAAVLLGCSYDDLRQRQKQYRQRRLLAGISTGMAASLALAGYFLYTSIQIRENLDQSLRNQSQYLASTSQELFSEGDRLTALALALEALPSEDNERPYVAAAEEALTDALMLYEADGQLISVAAFGSEGLVENFAVSDDGSIIYILDSQYNVTAWDTASYNKLSAINILGFETMNSVLLTDLNNNLLTLGGTDGDILMCYTSDGTKLWSMEHIEDIAFTADKQTLLAISRAESDDWTQPNTYELLHLNPETGERTAEPFVMFDRTAAYSPSFAAETCYAGQPVAINAYLSSEQMGILIADPAKQRCRTVLTYDSFFNGGTLTEDGKLYVMVSETDEVSNGRLSNYYFYTQAGAWLYCYDTSSARQLWRTYFTSYNYSETDSILPIAGTDTLFCQYGSAFLQVNAKNGKILKECHSTTIPLALQMREDNVWVLFTNGCAGSYNFETNTIGYIQYMENGLTMGHNNKGIYVSSQGSSNVLLYRTTADKSYEPFSGEYDDYIDSLRIHDNLLVTNSFAAMNLFDLTEGKLLWKTDTGYSNYLLGIASDGSAIYARKYSDIRRFDMQNGEMAEFPLPLTGGDVYYSMYYEAISFGNDTICCVAFSYADNQPYILFYNCSTHEYTITPFPVEEDISVWNSYGNYPFILQSTDTYALIRTAAGNLYRYDRTTGENTLIAENVSDDPAFLVDAENDRMIFSTSDGILLTDCSGQPVLTIPLPEMFAVSFFFYEENLLCLGSDGTLYRYDLEGNLLGTTGLSLFSNFFSQANNIRGQRVPIFWGVTPDNELILNVFRMGNIIDTESWERTCDIQQLLFYDRNSDSYVAQSNDMIFRYKRCTLDDIMTRAKESLGSFALTEEQRAYYGLN